MGKLFEELKRRKVFRVAAVYAVVAWVLIQVADTIAPMMNLPESAPRFILFALLILFPVALFLTWAYEIRPESNSSGSAHPAPTQIPVPQSQGLIYATFVLVLLVAIFQVVDRFLLQPALVTNTDLIAGTPSSTNTDVIRSSLNLGLFDSDGAGRQDISISPDGRRIYFSSYINGVRPMFIRNLDSFETTEIGIINGTGFSNSSFSPDGEWLVYTDADGLNKISVDGEQKQLLDSDSSPFTPHWVDDQTILYSRNDGLIYRISPSGGEPQSLEFPEDGTYSYHYPFALPDNKGILAAAIPRGMRHGLGSVVVFDYETGELRTLIERGYAPLYTPSGHLVYTLASLEGRGGAEAIIVPFDNDNLMLAGLEVSYSENTSGSNSLDFSDNGRMVVQPGRGVLAKSFRSMVWVDRTGNESPINLRPLPYSFPRISPDQEDLAVIVGDEQGTQDLWVYNFARNTLSRITFLLTANSPLWTPDGSKLVFGRNSYGLWQVNANGVGDTVRITTPPPGITHIPFAFVTESKDMVFGIQSRTVGRRSPELDTIFGTGNPVTAADIASLAPAQESSPQSLIAAGNYRETAAAISPDGNWIAYVSDETGSFEVYVRPYPNVNSDKWQISTNGGSWPHWRDDGGELIYIGEVDGTISFYAVAIANADQFSAGTSELLFGGNYVSQFDVTPDHQRFLLMRESASETNSSIPQMESVIMVENWFDELRRLAPPSAQ